MPVVRTAAGLRAVAGGKPVEPAGVEWYLNQKFGGNLSAARDAMATLAACYEPSELERLAYQLSERFRPAVPEGMTGWGAKGTLDLSAFSRLRPPI